MKWIAAFAGLAASVGPAYAQPDLVPGIAVQRAIAPGDAHAYTLVLDAGHSARLELRTDLDLAVVLRRPGAADGAGVGLIDVAGEEYSPQPMTIVAAEGGAHRIEVRLPADQKGGPYRLTLAVVRPATDEDRRHSEAEALLREGMRLFTQTTRESRLQAADRYRRSAELYRSLGDRVMEAKAIDKTGQVYNRLGEAQLALEAYERVLPMYRELGDRGNEASTLNNIGLERANLGRHADAIEPLEASAALFHAIGDTWTERSPHNNLGLTYFYMGEIDKATTAYERALALGQANYDESGEAFATMGLAALALLKGDLQSTLTLYGRALDGFRRIGNRQLEALALANIGATQLRFGDAEAALDTLLRSQDVRKLAPNRINEANTVLNIAYAYLMLGQARKGLDFAHASVNAFHEMANKPSESLALQGLARVQLALGDLEAASATFARARSLAHEAANANAEGSALTGLSEIRLRQGKAAEAVALASDALSIARESGLRLVEENSLAALAAAEAASGALDAAREHAAAAVALAESIRASVAGPEQRTGYLRAHHQEFRLLVDVLMRLHRERPSDGFDRQAFDVSERARARTLIDLLAESRSNIREGVDPALAAREQSLRGALAFRRAERDDRVQSLLVEYRAVQNDIRARSPRYAALVQPDVVDLAAVQSSLLDADTLLVEYALGDDRSYVWIVGPSSLSTHELGPRARIEGLARRAHEALSQPAADGAGDALRALARVVLEPIADRLGRKRLAIVAEGALQYIPFAALPDRAGQPLARRHEIVSLPSASTLRALRRDLPTDRTASPRPVMVVADPVFDASDARVRSARDVRATAVRSPRLERSTRESGAGTLERLWFSRREAETITALAGPAPVRKLVDFDASLERVTDPDLASYRVVHFATHGLLNNRHPDLSGLVFSLVDDRGRPREGFLPAYEVYNLRMNADLVVLSACQTALGEDIRGEGLVGLSRAFMYAGTPRVVASLWRVPDRATAALMERFYKGLLVERRSPADALRAAQAAVRANRRWRAPYYWAGFVLIGEWKP
jgi:CHAT domain-containing protein/tetratricopeptide (TPR) repeat protein